MNVLVLKDPKILGDKHPTYGYSVWSETDGDYPVMFNVQDEKKLMPGVRVTYEDSQGKTSAKGKDYLRLSKVKFEDSPQASVPFDTTSPTFAKANQEQSTKDQQITKNMVWKNLLNHYDLPSMTPDSEQWQQFWASVELHTEMLTNGNYDKLIGGSPASHPAETIKEENRSASTATTPSLKENWDKVTGDPGPSDEDM